MVFKVTYQTEGDSANPHSDFTHSKFFETNTVPDRPTIIKKLRDANEDFAEGTISITEYNEVAEAMRKAGFRVDKIQI